MPASRFRLYRRLIFAGLCAVLAACGPSTQPDMEAPASETHSTDQTPIDKSAPVPSNDLTPSTSTLAQTLETTAGLTSTPISAEPASTSTLAQTLETTAGLTSTPISAEPASTSTLAQTLETTAGLTSTPKSAGPASTSTLTQNLKPVIQSKAVSIVWETNFDTALAKAKTGNKMVMVDFFTDWCHWCKVLDEKTYTDSRVIQVAASMISAKIDAEKNMNIVRKYNVDGYPAILFLKPDGTEIHRISGFRPPEDFLPDMKAVLKGISPQQELDQMIKKGTDDPAALQRIGMSLLRKGENAKALPYFEKAAAKLKGKDALKVQQILPLLYLDAKQVEKANAALEEFRQNPAADAMDVNRVELRIALTQQDRKRAERVLDKMKTTASPEEKDQIEQFRKNLDEVMKSFAKQARQ